MNLDGGEFGCLKGPLDAIQTSPIQIHPDSSRLIHIKFRPEDSSTQKQSNLD